MDFREVVDELNKNPDKLFKSITNAVYEEPIYVTVDYGKIVFKDRIGDNINVIEINLDWKWKEVKEFDKLATWDEAVQAWKEDKTFIIRQNHRWLTQHPVHRLGCMMDESDEFVYGFSWDMVDSGLIYIVENIDDEDDE